MTDGYYYCLNCHSEITPDYNEHCCFCGTAAVAVSGDYSNEEVERAFDLLNKEQQGLIPVLPCKVGDTVYLEDGEKRTVEKIEILKVHNQQQLFYVFTAYSNTTPSKGYVRFYDYEIGITIFLAPEEAEEALKGKSDNGE